MAQKHIQLDLAIRSSLNTPLSGFIGFAAKADGLYQKMSSGVEARLLTLLDIDKLFYKPGIAGGQIAIGGINATDKLTFKATSYVGSLSGNGILFNVGSGGSITAIAIDHKGKVGINNTNPTAMLHLAASSGITNSAPLKFSSGTLLTTIENGSIEYDGNLFYGTINSQRLSFSMSNHYHGNISNDGRIGYTANLILVTDSNGYITTKSAGSSNQFLNGLGQWALATGATYDVFTETSNGLVPKSVSSNTTKYLRADGQWFTPAGSDTSGFVPYTGATSNVTLGTKKLLTDGGIGIGTISPSAKLHIVNDSNLTDGIHSALLIETAINAGARLLFGTYEDSYGYIQTYSFDNGWNSTSLLLQSKGGYVGIGTNNPSDLLSLGTSGSIEGRIAFAGLYSGSTILRPNVYAGNYVNLILPNLDGTLARIEDIPSYTLTRLSGNNSVYVSGDIKLYGNGKVSTYTVNNNIYISLSTLYPSDVQLGNVTNNAQWHATNHPTTFSGYGITETPWTLYLPLTGGTLTGNLSISKTQPTINLIGTTNDVASITFGDDGFIVSEIINDSSNGEFQIKSGLPIVFSNYMGNLLKLDSSSGIVSSYKFSTPSIRIGKSSTYGFVLTSDSYGNGTWQASTGGGVGTSYYKGPWDASTNTPTITVGVGTEGFYYKCTVAGTFNSISFYPNDEIYFNGTSWIRIPAIPYTLGQATSTTIGGLKIDDNTLKFNGNGQLIVQLTFNANHFERNSNYIGLKEQFFLDRYVPYTGANKDVDLGTVKLTTRSFCFNPTQSHILRETMFLRNNSGDGNAVWDYLPVAFDQKLGLVSISTSQSTPTESDGITYVKITTDGIIYIDNLVPYLGAVKDVNLGEHSIYAYNFILKSDRRLKCEIKSVEKRFIDIDYKQFKFNSNLDELRYGVIAQELLEVAPQFVKGSENTNYSVKYIDLLVYEIAYLKQELLTLQSKVYANS